MTKPNVYLSRNLALQRITNGKHQHKEGIPTLTTKITGSNNYFSLISLNINGLNSPIKRHRLTNWLQKQDPAFTAYRKHISEKKIDTTSE